MKLSISLFCILSTAILAVNAFQLEKLPVLTLMALPEVMANLNYPLETHYITTADGYILTYFRIQKKNQETIQQTGLPVLFFQHGLEDSSDTVCLNDEENAPALILANSGYDVWLGNSRGNRYSKNHTSLSTEDPKFWQFTFQDMGMYDIPAAFTYISGLTGQKINYVGHSQGTTQMFVALSRHEQAVEQNLLSYIALGPATWVGHVSSKLMVGLAENLPLIDTIIAAGIQQFLPYTNEAFIPTLCKYVNIVCAFTLYELMDLDPAYDNLARMDVFSGHIPAGTSTLNIRHWGQNIRSKEFKYFDFGLFKNLKVYGTASPPNIDVESISVPVHLFAGVTDELADVEDVAILRSHLTGSSNVTFNQYPFGHASFLIAKDASFMNDVLAILSDYNPGM